MFPLQYLFAIIKNFQHWFLDSGLGVGVVITEWCKLKVRAQVEFFTKFFSAMIFISV